MSVRIRCRRTGASNNPCFQIVAADIKSARDGKYIELLGWYDPKRKERNFFLKLDRVEEWTNKGAQPSAMVKTLMRKARKGLMAKAEMPAAAEDSAQVEEQETQPNQPL